MSKGFTLIELPPSPRLSQGPTPLCTRPRHSAGMGFTLIELSIVLVIIGLIIGGVLLGKDLIKASEMRAEISNIERYKTAINTFKLKYNAIPGDFSDTAVLTSTHYGNGNGILEGYSNWLEFNTVWEHLSLANLIAGKYTGGASSSCTSETICPFSKVAPDSVFWGWGPIGTWWAGAGNSVYGVSAPNFFPIPSKSNWGNGTYAVTDAYTLDTKIDDGKPDKGGVLVVNSQGTAGTCVTGTRNTVDGSVIYQLTSGSTSCYPHVKF